VSLLFGSCYYSSETGAKRNIYYIRFVETVGTESADRPVSERAVYPRLGVKEKCRRWCALTVHGFIRLFIGICFHFLLRTI
jgi:hypothetical protein